MGGLTSSAIFEEYVVSTKIGSSWGSVDEGLVDAKPNTQNNSSTPRTDWDAMVDNYEGRGSAIECHFEKEMDCLPKQLTVVLWSLFPVVVFWVVP